MHDDYLLSRSFPTVLGSWYCVNGLLCCVYVFFKHGIYSPPGLILSQKSQKNFSKEQTFLKNKNLFPGNLFSHLRLDQSLSYSVMSLNYLN